MGFNQLQLQGQFLLKNICNWFKLFIDFALSPVMMKGNLSICNKTKNLPIKKTNESNKK